MIQNTKSIIEAVIKGDPTISSDLATAALDILSGKVDLHTMDRPASMDRVLSRKEVARITGLSLPMVDVYGRRGVFRRVVFPGASRCSGYSAESIRAAMSHDKPTSK